MALVLLAACGDGNNPVIDALPCVCDAPNDAAIDASNDAANDAASDAPSDAPIPDAALALLSIDPTLHDFGSVILGCTGGPQTFRVTNTGGAAAQPLVVALEGSDATEFAFAGDHCSGVSLAPGASCAFDVSVHPAHGAGAKSAAIVVTGGAEPIMASVVATVLSASRLSVVPNLLQFGTIAVGTTAAKSITVAVEAGCPASQPLALSIGGSGAASFSTINDTCTGQQLAGGGTCSVDVIFAPTAAGDRAATLTVMGGPFATASLLGSAN